jgi:hypothetical protein
MVAAAGREGREGRSGPRQTDDELLPHRDGSIAIPDPGLSQATSAGCAWSSVSRCAAHTANRSPEPRALATFTSALRTSDR